MNKKREWLSDLRNLQGFTQQEVADKIGVERSTYAMYESGRRNPHVSTAQKIAATLKFEWTIFFENKCGHKLQRNKTA